MLNNKFQKFAAQATIALSATLPFAFASYAEASECPQLNTNNFISVQELSQKSPYPVGINVKPGSDMGNAPEIINSILQKSNKTVCYKNYLHSSSGETKFSFFTKGTSVYHTINGKEKDSFTIKELKSHKEILKKVADSGKLNRNLHANSHNNDNLQASR